MPPNRRTRGESGELSWLGLRLAIDYMYRFGEKHCRTSKFVWGAHWSKHIQVNNVSAIYLPLRARDCYLYKNKYSKLL